MCTTASARRCREPRNVRGSTYRSAESDIYVQVIDDLHGKTLVSASTAEGKKGRPSLGRQRGLQAKAIGKATLPSAPRPRASPKVVFDRGGYIYHGRVKAIADAAFR